jgi:hypothetical protein
MFLRVEAEWGTMVAVLQRRPPLFIVFYPVFCV